MAKYAWYTRLSDTLHRLTVLTLVGGSLYMSGGLVYTLYMNGRRYEDTVTTPTQKQIEGSTSKDEENKSTPPPN
ncbi:similar to Saccharomyces cerevisiae YML129C COX14 Mitochondrial membrane protein, involved in translational regulation of Cox1p and assembly of cytochrome c oxidase (complex IV) [Maudiozyma saulgeensis]|uniref:Similar to Saccharomyces cerevisiae YML129C COX14 Mitochondrial membrane protein, involved in translational regulation of Cox1p and assembly of cytochrome c oxidase (Complex IV) n=1 Tax=Maudiozyma saulgeensis TaxID=1789683 RepID=A0A1X7R4J9_9SACH|nr:similar to Saccharomyces cerevisiae YML129C COX14 Mitochondrial membrane protein, involved in translational regulation of Cox1p and assembly of cytochrome c oxidase (complex IV) [Kazachstania saulgeensis]